MDNARKLDVSMIRSAVKQIIDIYLMEMLLLNISTSFYKCQCCWSFMAKT